MYVFITMILGIIENNAKFKMEVFADPILHSALIAGNKEAAYPALYDLYTRYPHIVESNSLFSSERFVNTAELELGQQTMKAWTACGRGSFHDMAFQAGLRWLVSDNA